MANVADCGVAIKKADIERLNGAIKKTNEKDGYEIVSSWDAEYKDNKEKVHIIEKRSGVEDGKDSEWSITYILDECSMPAEVFNKKYRDKLFPLHETYKTVEDKQRSNGWEVNWKLLNAYSYQSDTNVQEYDDHITIYFGGRWGFPQDLEDTLNRAGVRWQGAVAEDGCEVYDSELGNEDFGLRLVVCGEDKDWHCVEDQTGVK